MKNPLTTACAAVILCATSFIQPASAIPTNFGGFINPAGMRLEDFSAQEKTWKSGAHLPGKWETWHDESVTDSGIELLRLNMSALVFGVPAKAVVVHRRNMQVEKIEVVFEPDKSTGDLDKLDRILKRNAATWSDGNDSGNTMKKNAAQFVFTTDATERRSIVTITPVRKAVAAAAP